MSSWLSGWEYPTRTQLVIGAAAAAGVGIGVAALLARNGTEHKPDDGGSPTPSGLRTISPSGPRNPNGPPPARQHHTGSGRFPVAKVPRDSPQEAEEESGPGAARTGPKTPRQQRRPGKERVRAPPPGSPLVRSHRPHPRAAAATKGTDPSPARFRTKAAPDAVESAGPADSRGSASPAKSEGGGVANEDEESHWLAERSRMEGRIDATGSAQIPPESRNGLAVDAPADSRGDWPIASPLYVLPVQLPHQSCISDFPVF